MVDLQTFMSITDVCDRNLDVYRGSWVYRLMYALQIASNYQISIFSFDFMTGDLQSLLLCEPEDTLEAKRWGIHGIQHS